MKVVGKSIDQIARFARQCGVRFHRQTVAEAPGYRIDHGTSIALVDPQARLAGLFTGLVDAANIASDLKQLAEYHDDPP